MPTLYVLRHGEAESTSPNGSDHARKLTAVGLNDIRRQTDTIFAHDGERVDAIYHSPYVRAKQTAATVNAALGAPLEPFPGLTPSGSVDAALDFLAGNNADILLVSHLPLVSDLVHRLAGQRPIFFPGTCVKLSRTDPFEPKANLMWVRHPVQDD